MLRGFTITRDISQRTGRATIIIVARPADLFMPASPTGSLFNEALFGPTIFGGPTAAPVAILLPGAPIEIWDGSGPTSSGFMFGEVTFGAPTFGGSTAGIKRFAGTVTKITPKVINLKENALGYTEYTLECQDYTTLLDTAVLSPITLPASSDQDMVRYIIAHTLPDIDTTHVDSITPLDAVALNGVSARQALESIASLSGGNFWIDENKALQYHSPTALPAPFGISDTPDNSTTFYGLFADYQYSEDFSTRANRVTVIGGGGSPPTVTVDDAPSQSQYGRVFERTFIDTSLLTLAAVTAKANVYLQSYKQPQKAGRFTTRYQGLDIGQLVPVTCQALRISGSFLIRRVTLTWLTVNETRYVVEFGDWTPDLIRYLRALNALSAAKPTFNDTVAIYDADDTITVPPGVVSMTVAIWGPGGRGGTDSGGGGGGGAFVSSTVTVVPGAVYTITVPAGGSELPAWFISPTTIAADAGKNGGDFFGSGGAAGLASASVGSTKTDGVPGGNYVPGAPSGGGDGGAAANGGGSGGAGCPPNIISHAGVDGGAPGGGGGGGGNVDSGGLGGNGRVKLTYSVG